jgi:hypothetical protein
MIFDLTSPFYDSNSDPLYRKDHLEKGSIQVFAGQSNSNCSYGIYAFFLSFHHREYTPPADSVSVTVSDYFGLNDLKHAYDGYGLIFCDENILDFTGTATSLYSYFHEEKPLLLLGQMGLLLWINDLAGSIQQNFSVYPSVWLSSPFNKPGWYLHADKNHRLTPQAVNTDLALFTLEKSPLTIEGDSLFFAGPDLPSLVQLPRLAHLLPVVTKCSIEIFADGATAAQVFLKGVTEDAGQLPLAIPFTAVPGKSVGAGGGITSTQFQFPFHDHGEMIAGQPLQVTITPLSKMGSLFVNQPLVTLCLTGAQPVITTAYRTIFGEPISLQATNPTEQHFISCYGLSGEIFLAPNGTYGMTVPFTPDAGEPYQLVCGLSGLETVTFENWDFMTFTAGWPWQASMTARNPVTGQPSYQVDPGTDTPYSTSAVSFSKNSGNKKEQGILYTSQAPGSLQFRVQTGNTQLEIQQPGGAYIDSFFVPTPLLIMPYGNIKLSDSGLGSKAADYAALENGYFMPLRYQTVMDESSTRSAPASLDNAVTVTPQGFSIQYDANGDPLSIQIAAANSLTTDVSISFSGDHLGDLLASLNAAQPFIVMTCLPADDQATNILKIDGWSFNCILPDSLSGNGYETVIIIKTGTAALSQMVAVPDQWSMYGSFNDTNFDPNGVLLSTHLCGYIQNARQLYNNGEGIAELGKFLDIADDPDWSGMMLIQPAINPPGSDTNPSDDSLTPLFLGTDGNTLYAHHLAMETNFVDTTQNPIQQSSLFGLIHYLRPGTPPGNMGFGKPAFVPSNIPYDYQLLFMHAEFQHSQMMNFTSQSQLVIESIMGTTVTQAPANATVVGGNTLPIQGTALKMADGGFNYAFTMAAGFSTTLFLDGPAIAQFTINQMLTNCSNEKDSISISFLMSGALGTVAGTSIDLLSYSSIAFENYQLTLSYDWSSTPPVQKFTEVLDSFLLLPLKEQAATDAQPDSSVMPLTNLYRPDSLAGQMPISFSSLIIPVPGTKPEDLGYFPVAQNGRPPVTLMQWYGMVFSLSMGNTGASGSAALLSAQLLLAWDNTAKASDPPPVQVYLILSGPNGVPLQLVIEDVIKLGPKSLQLIIDTSGVNPKYLLELQSIGLTILSQTFPSGGMANLFLAGFTDDNAQRSLAWFGGYAKNKKQ